MLQHACQTAPGLPGSHMQKRPDQPLKQPISTEKKPNTRWIHDDTFETPNCTFERHNLHILYIKRVRLIPLMNFSKLLVLLKSNLKL